MSVLQSAVYTSRKPHISQTYHHVLLTTEDSVPHRTGFVSRSSCETLDLSIRDLSPSETYMSHHGDKQDPECHEEASVTLSITG